MKSGNDQVLTLPWNRLPNYLICVVAAVNLIAGSLCLREALAFSREGNFVAVFAVGVFGVILIWVAWCFRKGVLPVSFVADAERRECGFRFGPWWNGRFDLSGIEGLTGELRESEKGWRWSIRTAPDDRWIYGPRGLCETEAEARKDCETAGKQLADHLSLPLTFKILRAAAGQLPEQSHQA